MFMYAFWTKTETQIQNKDLHYFIALLLSYKKKEKKDNMVITVSYKVFIS